MTIDCAGTIPGGPLIQVHKPGGSLGTEHIRRFS